MSAKTGKPITAGVLAATVDLLWRQWRAIGGAAASGPARAQVDLEVLCLASLTLEPHEPRLWDTMADWIRTGSTLVSVQRLKNLSESFPRGAERLPELGRVAIGEAKDARWRSLDHSPARGAARDRKPVKSRTAGPSLVSGQALVLRLRSAFGIGVKADLIAYLLGSPIRATVSGAAAALGYGTPAVFRALQDFNAAGLLRTWEGPGAAEHWIDRHGWDSLLGGAARIAHWGHWHERIGFACDVIAWEETTTRRIVSDYAKGVELRNLTEMHRAALARALDQHTTVPDTAAVADWKAFLDILARQIEATG